MPHYGFNLQWIFWTERDSDRPPAPADERALDFIAARGFNFVRIPASYWFWTKRYRYDEPDESVLRVVDSYIDACRERGLHMSLCLHRAPGYCINENHQERHNLWLNPIAQDGFTAQWRMFAERYAGIGAEALSFDLVNEPPRDGRYGMTREGHEAVIRAAVAAIRDADPARPITIDGLDGGNEALPELADLGLTHSCRGYQPQNVSHYRADWWPDWESAAAPAYPGAQHLGRVWDRQALVDHYAPWRAVEASGTPIHVGEFGCYNQTPNDVALRWLGDLLSVWKTSGWGYALWEFEGPFGIIGHGRPGARYEKVNGYEVDRDLLELLESHRVDDCASGETN